MMNKHRLLLALALLFFFAAGAQQHFIGLPHVFNTPEDVAAARVNLSQVFRYRTTREGAKDSTIVQENFYDSLGRLYRSYGSLRETLYSYDGDRLQRIDIRSQFGLSTSYRYLFDASGILKEEIVTERPSGETTHYFFQYNDGYLQQVMRRQNSEPEPALFHQYTYKDDRLSNVAVWDKGKLLYREFYEYEGGTKTARWQQKKKLIKRYSEEYNDSGQLVRHTSFATLLPTGKLLIEKHPAITVYYYDANGLLEKTIYATTTTTTIGLTEDISKQSKPRQSLTNMVDVYHYFKLQPND